MTYTVQPGDSLWRIARRFGLTLEALLAANPQITNPDLIQPGQVVNLPHGTPPRELPRAPEPYPPVRVEGPNQAYARLLHEDYAGRVSEVSAIMQYLHHHLEMEECPGWQEVAHLEEGISIVEMGHMEMLGEALVLLGSSPRYEGADQRPWTAEYVAYHDYDPCAQLRADIQGERDAIAQYQYHVREIGDCYLQALLQRIIRDEELHIDLLSQALNRLCP